MTAVSCAAWSLSLIHIFILDQLVEEHMKTGKPIFYTSADSVFQIACHEETFGLDKLYEPVSYTHLDVYKRQTLTRLIMPTSLCRTVGRIRRSRRIRQSAHNA